MKQERRHMIVSGRVQGVGFRYTACMLAGAMGLTGWVKNVWDGTVEMEVQGEGRVIDRFLERLGGGRFIRIEHIEERRIPLQEERRFEERY